MKDGQKGFFENNKPNVYCTTKANIAEGASKNKQLLLNRSLGNTPHAPLLYSELRTPEKEPTALSHELGVRFA